MGDMRFYDESVREGLEEWLEANGYVWSVEQNLWLDAEGNEADWDAIYDEVWAEDDITGNGPCGYPYEDDEALFSAIRNIDFEHFRAILEDFGISIDEEIKHRTSWREMAQWADCLARLDALDRVIWAVQRDK